MKTHACVLLALVVGGCVKIPISNVNASFSRASAEWFEAEDTLFLFYEVGADQGLSDRSVIEVTYRSSTILLDWTPLDDLPMVHAHVPVDCGPGRICGSASLALADRPLTVGLRLRYDRRSALALDAPTSLNITGLGPAHRNRSFLVYGVFDASNRRIQWRGRHRFAQVRNMEAEALGLRRFFRVEEQRVGTESFAQADNFYGYGIRCPSSFRLVGLGTPETENRAVFEARTLPIDVTAEAAVCALSTVRTAVGPFTTGALARKNPEVLPAFPLLRSPIRETSLVRFYLGPCDRVISRAHDDMQRQRLLFEGPVTHCTDRILPSELFDVLVRDFTEAISRRRREGRDMVLVVGVHRDNIAVADAVERVLEVIVPPERDRGTPRLAGAFVFDSDIRDIASLPLSSLVLWCPAPSGQTVDGVPNVSESSCAITPDNPVFNLGPLSFSALPILPSRNRYLRFIDEFSEGQAGRVDRLTALAPEFTPATENVEVGFGVATFFNGEQISANPDDAFSFCGDGTPTPVVIRSGRTQDLACGPRNPLEEFCYPSGVAPLSDIGAVHTEGRDTSYFLGLFWDFPWLLRLDYQIGVAGSINALGLSVPFGPGISDTSNFGSAQWLEEAIPLGDKLLQCRRFCDHPTFDSAGVYQVLEIFRDAYATRCYRPFYPAPGDSSFPLDP